MSDSNREDASREGFELLSDDTRLEILQVLAERLRERPQDPTVGFSDLRRRAGLRDSGNFNYHLGKLEGRFVTKTEDGYRIAPAGIRVVAAMITGIYGADERLGPTEIEDPCPVCAEPLVATYENGVLRFQCSNDHEFQNSLPPGAIDDRELNRVIDVFIETTRQDLEQALDDICPYCFGRLEWEVDPTGDRTLPEFATRCPRCGVRVDVPAVSCLVTHPAGVSFFYDHGIDVRQRPFWAPEFYTNVSVETTARSGQVEITVELDDDWIRGRFDESLTVREIERKGES